ncbi:hypothetical protein KJ596_03685 [Patescibacteria group bacterium]|nr:hypothetical protein [Patescibacteria group bacterium]MBU1868287.1 hypothetical protein [Patescibacteria group bacterium]
MDNNLDSVKGNNSPAIKEGYKSFTINVPKRLPKWLIFLLIIIAILLISVVSIKGYPRVLNVLNNTLFKNHNYEALDNGELNTKTVNNFEPTPTIQTSTPSPTSIIVVPTIIPTDTPIPTIKPPTQIPTAPQPTHTPTPEPRVASTTMSIQYAKLDSLVMKYISAMMIESDAHDDITDTLRNFEDYSNTYISARLTSIENELNNASSQLSESSTTEIPVKSENVTISAYNNLNNGLRDLYGAIIVYKDALVTTSEWRINFDTEYLFSKLDSANNSIIKAIDDLEDMNNMVLNFCRDYPDESLCVEFCRDNPEEEVCN